MYELHRPISSIALSTVLLALVPGCPGDVLPDTSDTDGSTSDSSNSSSDDVDSTGTPGECTPLSPEDVSVDLTLPMGCYSVSDVLTIDHRLDIEPGAQLSFGATAGLTVGTDGILSAIGTEPQPILMTPDGDQGWLGLHWLGSASADNRLEYVRIEDPAETGISVTSGARLQVSACEVIGASEFGLSADEGSSLTVGASTFEDNGIPLAVGIDGVSGIAPDNALGDNIEPIVQVGAGTLSDDAQWANPGVPLRLTGNARIESALTMDPGLTVEMPQGANFVVSTQGSLNAEGTAQAPIVMRGQQDERGYWQGLSVESKASANAMRHCVLEGGGSSGWNGSEDSVAMVWMPDQSKLTMSDCMLRRSDGAALTSFGGADLSGFANNTIEDNRQTLTMSPEMVGEIESSTTFVGNDEDYVRVGRAGSNNDVVETPATWAALGVPYRVIDRFYVESDWTVAPGVTIEVMQDREIIIEPGGSVHAVGSPEAPIAFVGAEALPGYWKGLEVLSVSASNELQLVEIRHAGSSGFNGNEDSDGALFIDGSLNISDSVVSDSGGHGAVVWLQGQLLGCTDVSFADNVKSSVFVYASGDQMGSSACP